MGHYGDTGSRVSRSNELPRRGSGGRYERGLARKSGIEDVARGHSSTRVFFTASIPLTHHEELVDSQKHLREKFEGLSFWLCNLRNGYGFHRNLAGQFHCADALICFA